MVTRNRSRQRQSGARLDRAQSALGCGRHHAQGAGGRRRIYSFGTKLFVGDAHLADVVVVAARTRDGSTLEDGISLFLVPKDARGLTATLLPTIDETRKLCEVRLDNVALPAAALLGDRHEGWAPLSRVVSRATVALAAEMCGGAQPVLDMTVAYAKIRIAFGKPIGSYQGVKHQAADMLVAIENAKSLTYYAAWAVDEGLDEGPLAVSMAKAAASDMHRKVASASIQLHGGIGMTWEHDLQLYFKRAKASEVAFGDAAWHGRFLIQIKPCPAASGLEWASIAKGT